MAGMKWGTAGNEMPGMVGKTFGRLLVLRWDKQMSHPAHGKRRDCYLCRCSCGVKKLVSGNCLRTSHTQSCGCLQREKVREAVTGDKCHLYIDGRTEKRKIFYESIRRRDNYLCTECGKTQEQNRIDSITKREPNGEKLSVHHKDHCHENNIDSNCITLCKSCHAIESREYDSAKADEAMTELMWQVSQNQI